MLSFFLVLNMISLVYADLSQTDLDQIAKIVQQLSSGA
jgi:hypothetical protein